MPSPFRLEGTELDLVLAMEGRFESLAVGSMPLMGMTAPMDAVKTWTQALAETIGGATVLQALYPAADVTFTPIPSPLICQPVATDSAFRNGIFSTS